MTVRSPFCHATFAFILEGTSLEDLELRWSEAKRVAFAIINALDDTEAVPDQITDISLGGYPEIWISDAASDES